MSSPEQPQQEAENDKRTEKDKIEIIKNKANEAFSEYKFKEAIKLYTKAIKKIKRPQNAKASDNLTLLYSNRSAAYLHLLKLPNALEDAEKVIELNSNWYKGYFRKAEVLAYHENFEEANQYYIQSYNLLKAQKLDHEDLQFTLEERIHVMEVRAKMKPNIIFHQLTLGKEIGRKSLNPIKHVIFKYCRAMKNQIYIIGCSQTKECMIVDPCWDVDGIIKVIRNASLKLIGVIVTHYHFDHVGGIPPPPFDRYRIKVPGLAVVMERFPDIRVYIGPEDSVQVIQSNNLQPLRVIQTQHEQQVSIGKVSIRFLHTPGHSGGSQCILVEDKLLFSGDTLFYRSCGRYDFAGGSPSQLYQSLQNVLRNLADEIVVYPGHDYGAPWTTIFREKKFGLLRHLTVEEWTHIMETKFKATEQQIMSMSAIHTGGAK